MSIAWRLAWRDLRRGGRGLLLLALCLFLGSAALAGIGSLSASIIAALDAGGRTMLGGDLEFTVSQRRATVEEAAAVAALGRSTELVSMRAMVDAGSGPVLVDLRAVDAAWPLIGRFQLMPGALADRPRGNEIAIAPALADRLRIRVGDKVRVGIATLRVIGVIAQEPDRLGAGFALGPPALVDLTELDQTGLIQPGSLYESHFRLLLPGGASGATTGARFTRRFANAGWRTRGPDQAAGGLRRGIDQLGQFLLLVGLAALTVAGVGVGSGVAAYLAAKTRTIATLKVLGARAPLIGSVFLMQIGATAALAVAAGLGVGALTPWAIAQFAGDALPVPPRLALYPAPLATAAALSLIAALLFALPALAAARRVPAATLLREAVGEARRFSWRLALGMAALVAALVALAVLTATDRVLAGGFVAAVAALLLVLWGVGLLLRLVLTRLPRPRAALPRLALANLHRPGAQTDRLVVALGLGFSLFVALAAIDTSLSAELAGAAPAKAPRFFAIDLQPEDVARFRTAVLAVAPDARIESSPSLRGSVTAVKGIPVARLHVSPDAWVLRGDRTLTWSATVPPRNTVVAGRWWPRGYRGPPLISIEDRAAAALGLHVGDALTISVLGVDVPARIAALRHIDWGGTRPQLRDRVLARLYRGGATRAARGCLRATRPRWRDCAQRRRRAAVGDDDPGRRRDRADRRGARPDRAGGARRRRRDGGRGAGGAGRRGRRRDACAGVRRGDPEAARRTGAAGAGGAGDRIWCVGAAARLGRACGRHWRRLVRGDARACVGLGPRLGRDRADAGGIVRRHAGVRAARHAAGVADARRRCAPLAMMIGPAPSPARSRRVYRP